MLQQLEPNQRTAVQMCVMEGLSYAAAAKTIGLERGIKTDPKTVWRWARNGVQALGKMFERSGWAGMMEPKLLFEED
jgi:DNA-directed RNA polymerase specialized sigma24 family protein